MTDGEGRPVPPDEIRLEGTSTTGGSLRLEAGGSLQLGKEREATECPSYKDG
jgi:hypothetical protein